jgi:hypothetical protein
MEKINEILKANGDAFVKVIQNGLSSIGLKNSKLYNSVESEVNNGVLTIQMYDYAMYVISGRKAGVKKVPISVLISWIKQKGIQPSEGQSVNSLAFAIQTSIYKNGIRPRPFIPKDAVKVLVANISKQLLKATKDTIINRIQKLNKK